MEHLAAEETEGSLRRGWRPKTRQKRGNTGLKFFRCVCDCALRLCLCVFGGRGLPPLVLLALFMTHTCPQSAPHLSTSAHLKHVGFLVSQRYSDLLQLKSAHTVHHLSSATSRHLKKHYLQHVFSLNLHCRDWRCVVSL